MTRLTSDEIHTVLMSHMINNNIDEIKVYPPSERKNMNDEVCLVTSCGKDEKGLFISFQLRKDFNG